MAVRTNTAEPKRAMPDALADCDDGKLMARVAEARDEQAFAEVLRRHQSAAFNLACYLTRSRDEAEEVLQDAFLKVWRHAEDFRAEGNARNWLLKIVARETFRRRERIRSNEEKKVRAQNRGPVRTADAPDQGAERDELLGALRIHLQDLPEDERRAVALYYGANCTQEEIGAALDCSQNKISYLLTHALDKLRNSLTQAGYAAALPLLAEDGLRNAICGGGDAPASVAAAVLRSLKAGAAEHSRRVIAAKGGLGAGAYVGAALALAAAGAWWALSGSPAAPAMPEASRPPEAAPGPPAASVPPAVEVIYEDEFDGTAIDPFWASIEPPAREGYYRCGLDSGWLLVFTGTPEARTDMSAFGANRAYDDFHVFPELVLTTKPVPLDGAALLYRLTEKEMRWNKGYELRIELLGEDGQVLGGNAQVRASEKEKEPVLSRYLNGTPSQGPAVVKKGTPLASAADAVALLVDPSGRIYEVDREGGLFAYAGTPRPAVEVRLRLTLKIRGSKAYAMWLIGRVCVARVRGWNDPRVLRELVGTSAKAPE